MMRPAQRGATLLELLIVLLIVASVAVMLLPTLTVHVPVGTSTKSSQEVATLATLRAVREAIAGEHGLLENLGHQPNALAITASDLVREEPPMVLHQTAPELVEYQPALGIGWQGPYLLPSGVNQQGQPTVVDGWGNEIEIQLEVRPHRTSGRPIVTGLRIISRGPDGLLQTTSGKVAQAGSKAQWSLENEMTNDDVVVSVPLSSQQP